VSVTIDVSKDGWTGGIQVSIGDRRTGHRLAGPKFNGSSAILLSRVVDPDTAADIGTFVRLHSPLAVVVEAGALGMLRLSLTDGTAGLVLAGRDVVGPFNVVKRGGLDNRDVESMLRYLAGVA
jgi:hypothetical protein